MEATTKPLVMEQLYNASPDEVWEAITDNDKMKQWYFDLPEFKAEVGFTFTFTAGDDNKQYVHVCEVTQVVPGKKLAYTWRYEGYPGISEVTFELFPEGDKTRLKLTHTGIESFAANGTSFLPASFTKGWTYILGTSLKNFVEA